MIARKKRQQPLIPLASMGDIAFLLIIFFMLTATFMKDTNLELDPASSEDIDQVKMAPLSVTMDKHNVIRLQGLESTASEIEGAVSVMLQDSKDKTVQVRMHKKLKKNQYMPLLEALSNAGAKVVLVGERDSG